MSEFFHPSFFFVGCAILLWLLPGALGRWLPPLAAIGAIWSVLTMSAGVHGAVSYLGLTPSEDSSGQTVRKGPITKAGNRRVRRLLIEAGWHQRLRGTASRGLKARRKGQPGWVVGIAEKAQERLHRRYVRLSARGKPANQVVTAVARELAGFVWAIACQVTPTEQSAAPEIIRTCKGKVYRLAAPKKFVAGKKPELKQ